VRWRYVDAAVCYNALVPEHSGFISQSHYNWSPNTTVISLPLHFHAHSCTERVLSIHKSLPRSIPTPCPVPLLHSNWHSVPLFCSDYLAFSFFNKPFPLQATKHVPVVTELCTLISNTFYILYFLPPVSLHFLCSRLMFRFPFILLHYSFSFYSPKTPVHTMF